jgi:GTP-binding protein
LLNLQERGVLFIPPGIDVYEGMIIGENARQEDMDVNPAKEKKATNIRSSTQEMTEGLIPHHQLSLEQALEYLREDECLEVTPLNLRLRKATLGALERGRAKKRADVGARA